MNMKINSPVIKRSFIVIITLALLLLTQLPSISAHGGEDHGEEQTNAPIAATGQMNIKIGKTSSLEVLVKYPTPPSGQETLLKIFVTDLTTNSPMAGMKISISLSYAGKRKVAELLSGNRVVHADSEIMEVVAKATETPGIYEARVIFPEAGQYNMALRLIGTSVDAQVLITDLVVPDKLIISANHNSAGSPMIVMVLSLLLIAIAVIGYHFWSRASKQDIHTREPEQIV